VSAINRSSAYAAARGAAFVAITLVATLVSAPQVANGSASLATASSASTASPAARRVPTDPDLNARDCGLLGRLHVGKRGCARHRCVPGAVPYKNSLDAEMCALRGAGNRSFGAPVEFQRCKALGRRWLAQVNWCASNPDRSVPLIRNAPACFGGKTDYVTLRESEGRYDMCLRPGLTEKVLKLAKREGTTLAAQVLRRSRLQCGYRPRHVFTEGRCRKRLSEGPRSSEGSLMIGDSITWRGTDELAPMIPDLDVDGIPSRNLTTLKPRLARYRDDYGQPRGLIVALGANGASGAYKRGNLKREINSLPANTVVMLVIPFRYSTADRTKRTEFTKRYQAWMTDIARSRPKTCTANWASVVEANPGILVDTVHPKHEHEDLWARWIATEWKRCQANSA
jgi:hypothetical protein